MSFVVFILDHFRLQTAISTAIARFSTYTVETGNVQDRAFQPSGTRMSIISGAYHVANPTGHFPKHKLVWLDNNASKKNSLAGSRTPLSRARATIPVTGACTEPIYYQGLEILYEFLYEYNIYSIDLKSETFTDLLIK